MLWFNIGFPIAMILAPLCIAAAVRRTPEGASAAIARAGMLRLVAGTAAALALFALCWLWLDDLARFSWVLFFPLFFGLAMPTIVARNPDWAGPHAAGRTTRSASLVRRDTEPAAPAWMWAASIAVMLIAVLLIAARPWGPAFDDAARRATILALILQVLCGGTLLAVLAMCLPMVNREPEPLDGAGSPALVEAYAGLRRFRRLAFLWLFGIGMTCMVAIINVGVAWAGALGAGASTMLAIGGAVGGSLLGVCGAVLGTIAGLRRVRINGMLRELEQHGHPAE